VTLVVFCIYSGAMGAVLLFAPRTILPMFGVEEAVNAYTYMLGFVLLASSFYYCASGLARNRHFARLTIYTRFASPVVTVLLPGRRCSFELRVPRYPGLSRRIVDATDPQAI